MPISIPYLPTTAMEDLDASSRPRPRPMARTAQIIRKSVHTFLQNYHYFTSTAALLAFPFSASILLSQSLIPSSSSSLLPAIYARLLALFHAAGFPPSSEFFTLLCLKLSQTISSSIFTFPFTLTFLLLSKACVIQSFNDQPQSHHKPSASSLFSIFSPLFFTYICNSFLILSANATVFCFLFFAFNFVGTLGFSSPTCFLLFSAAAAVLYSIILANAIMICNLSLVLSGMERSGGYLAILKACVLIRGRASTALSLALPVTLAMAGVEALFQFRIVRTYYHSTGETSSSLLLGLEGTLIAYVYSILVVLDTIVSCIFFKCCKASSSIDQEGSELGYRIAIAEDKFDRNHMTLKVLEDLP